jgi:transposase InsO family protein
MLMYVVPCHLPHSVVVCIMSFLLMITQEKCWIYFLKAKSDTFDKFKEYKAFIEKQTGKHIRTPKTDNGGQFESLQFEDFCKEAGIKRQLTVPYNPQQNGVVERKNRTICEAAKAMMFDQDLSNFL